LSITGALGKTIAVIVFSAALVIGVTLFSVEDNITKQTQEIIKTKNNEAKLVAKKTEVKLLDAAKTLEITSRLPQVSNVIHANSISEELKGIPEDLDKEKRQVAQSILAGYAFESVSFVMSNGDMYMVEPYSYQLSQPQLNFATADWHSKTIQNGKTYLSEVFTSTASQPAISINVPVYFDDTVIGIWRSVINLNVIEAAFKELELGKNVQVIIVDHKGNEISSSENLPQDTKSRVTGMMEGTMSSLIEESGGTVIEDIGGKKMVVTYHPIQLPSYKWALFFLQPYDDAFSTLNSTRIQSWVLIITIGAIISVSGYILYRAFRANLTLTNQLRQADTAKEEFSSMITHELKTPLVPIQGYTELLLDGTLGELTERQKEKIQVIYNNSIHLLQLIQDILDVHKLELGKIKFDMQDNDAKELIEQSIDAFRPVAKAKEVSLTNTMENTISVKCDQKRILQVINNLVSNALKFVPEKTGKIKVSAKSQDGQVIFSVKDNGIGIPKDKQHNLFKKFYQVDTSLTRNAGGTGLGLAICSGIVGAHGGRIWVESEEGKGSVFYFSISNGMKS